MPPKAAPPMATMLELVGDINIANIDSQVVIIEQL
jgi:hypothetical protein